MVFHTLRIPSYHRMEYINERYVSNLAATGWSNIERTVMLPILCVCVKNHVQPTEASLWNALQVDDDDIREFSRLCQSTIYSENRKISWRFILICEEHKTYLIQFGPPHTFANFKRLQSPLWSPVAATNWIDQTKSAKNERHIGSQHHSPFLSHAVQTTQTLRQWTVEISWKLEILAAMCTTWLPTAAHRARSVLPCVYFQRWQKKTTLPDFESVSGLVPQILRKCGKKPTK